MHTHTIFGLLNVHSLITVHSHFFSQHSFIVYLHIHVHMHIHIYIYIRFGGKSHDQIQLAVVYTLLACVHHSYTHHIIKKQLICDLNLFLT